MSMKPHCDRCDHVLEHDNDVTTVIRENEISYNIRVVGPNLGRPVMLCDNCRVILLLKAVDNLQGKIHRQYMGYVEGAKEQPSNLGVTPELDMPLPPLPDDVIF